MAAQKVIKSTTQEHLDIEDIVDSLVLLKDGSAAMIVTTTAVNFGLLSETEQDATIYAYAALLNSLTFPIQIYIRSNHKDISGYEKLLKEREIQSAKPENKERIRKYREFIEETVRQRNVLDKKFYMVIPFYVLELGVTKSASALAKSGSKNLPFDKSYILGRAKMSLEPKRDHLIHQLTRLGLRARQLNTKELIQLFFEIYNPSSAHGQVLASPEEYETPIVQPAVAFQESPQIESPPEPEIQPTNESNQFKSTPLSTSIPKQTISDESPSIVSPKAQKPTTPDQSKDNHTLDAQSAIDQALNQPEKE